MGNRKHQVLGLTSRITDIPSRLSLAFVHGIRYSKSEVRNSGRKLNSQPLTHR